MATENEIKLLGIDINKIHKFFNDENVKLVKAIHYKRIVFDTIPYDQYAWIRLRTDGDITTITYKKNHKDAIDGTEEIEIETEDFVKTKEILERAGLKGRNYQENKREIYKYLDCEISIDYWPRIPAYVEIEADTKTVVENCLLKFAGLYESSTSKSTEEVYRQHGIELRNIDKLVF